MACRVTRRRLGWTALALDVVMEGWSFGSGTLLGGDPAWAVTLDIALWLSFLATYVAWIAWRSADAVKLRRAQQEELLRLMATWWEITFTGEPADADFEHVAEMVKEGFTSGELINDEDGKG